MEPLRANIKTIIWAASPAKNPEADKKHASERNPQDNKERWLWHRTIRAGSLRYHLNKTAAPGGLSPAQKRPELISRAAMVLKVSESGSFFISSVSWRYFNPVTAKIKYTRQKLPAL